MLMSLLGSLLKELKSSPGEVVGEVSDCRDTSHKGSGVVVRDKGVHILRSSVGGDDNRLRVPVSHRSFDRYLYRIAVSEAEPHMIVYLPRVLREEVVGKVVE